MALSDNTLIKRVLMENDQRSFEALVYRYQSRLRYSLRQLTDYDEPLTDDLAQEAFIKAYQNLDRFRGDAHFFTWLYRIAWRCFADYHRRRKPEQALDESPVLEVSYVMQEQGDMHRDFANVLQNFSPEQRMVLHLHLQREFTQSEIAKIMDCPLGTVKSHIQRGRLKLQQYMEAWEI
jgi:RNA polymerase sigma-70 factor (ECF subfamily)